MPAKCQEAGEGNDNNSIDLGSDWHGFLHRQSLPRDEEEKSESKATDDCSAKSSNEKISISRNPRKRRINEYHEVEFQRICTRLEELHCLLSRNEKVDIQCESSSHVKCTDRFLLLSVCEYLNKLRQYVKHHKKARNANQSAAPFAMKVNAISAAPQSQKYNACKVFDVLLPYLRKEPEMNNSITSHVLLTIGYLIQDCRNNPELQVQLSQSASREYCHREIIRIACRLMLNIKSTMSSVFLTAQICCFLIWKQCKAEECCGNWKRTKPLEKIYQSCHVCASSRQMAQMFLESNGIQACICVLQRGYIMSDMLNSSVANLLSHVCDHFPEKKLDVFTAIGLNLEQRALLLQKITNSAPYCSCAELKPVYQYFDKALELSCISLMNGLLHFCKAKKFNSPTDASTIKALFMLLSLGLFKSQTMTELSLSILHNLIDTQPQLLPQYFNLIENEHVVSQFVKSQWQLDEKPVTLLGKILARMTMEEVTKSQRDDNLLIKIFNRLLLGLNEYLQKNLSTDKNVNWSSVNCIFATNTLRLFRVIINFGGKAARLLEDSEELLVAFVKFLEKIDDFDTNTMLRIVQELGLMAEPSSKVSYFLARHGACKILVNVFVRNDGELSILCAITRTLASLISHGDELGGEIANIAIKEGCHKVLTMALENYAVKVDTSQDILLNLVAALGRMIDHCNKLSSSDVGYGEDDSIRKIHDAKSVNDELSVPVINSSLKILSRLNCMKTLVWNTVWVLIYLLTGPDRDKYAQLLLDRNCIQIISKVCLEHQNNEAFVISISKLLWNIIKSSNSNIKDTAPLAVRLKLLHYCSHMNGSNAEYQTISSSSQDIADAGESNDIMLPIVIKIDPLNIAKTSLEQMKKYTGKQLRQRHIQVVYESDDFRHLGVDAGGVRRDWLSRLSETLFDPQFELVIAGHNPSDSVQISPLPTYTGAKKEDLIECYRLMGRVIGLCLLYQDPLGIDLIPSFYKLMLEENPEFEDLKHASPEYYIAIKNLKAIQNNNTDGTFEKTLQDLTFTVNSCESILEQAFERKQSVVSLIGTDRPSNWNTHDFEVKLPDNVVGTVQHKKLRRERAHSCPNMQCNSPNSPHEADTSLRLSYKMQQGSQTTTQDLFCIPKLESSTNRINEDNLKSAEIEEKEDISTEAVSQKLRMRKRQRMLSDLTLNGHQLRLTPSNFDEYIKLLVSKLLVENLYWQMKFIKEGFYDIIPGKISRDLLSHSELAELIRGERNICIDLWRMNTKILNGSEDTEQIKWFWDFASALPRTHRQRLLQWATGLNATRSRGSWNNPFTIQLTEVSNAAQNERLPSVIICAFRLLLPKYWSKEQLERKFMLAICDVGFGNC